MKFFSTLICMGLGITSLVICLGVFSNNGVDFDTDVTIHKNRQVNITGFHIKSETTYFGNEEDDGEADGAGVGADGLSGDLKDLRDLTKYVSGLTLQHYSTNRGGNFKQDTAEWTIDGKKIEKTGLSHNRSDCSGGVCLMLYLCGLAENDMDVASGTLMSWGQAVNAETMADLQVGDILTNADHVAMVNYIEGDNVYFFDWGSTDSIQECTRDGYHHHVFPKSTTIYAWRNTSATVVRRSTLIKSKGGGKN